MKTKLLASSIILSVFTLSANGAAITSDTDAALSGATIETFDSIAQGEYLSLSVPGATISSNMTVSSSYMQYGKTGNNLQNTNGSPSSFSITFDNTVSAFGIWGGAYNNSWTFSAYDSSNNLIESLNTSISCCSSTFFGMANLGMKSVTLSGFGDWVAFDDLTFKPEVSAVPVPAAVWLMGSGLLGLMGFNRKAKKLAA